jgi:hypothetical protein
LRRPIDKDGVYRGSGHRTSREYPLASEPAANRIRYFLRVRSVRRRKEVLEVQLARLVRGSSAGSGVVIVGDSTYTRCR